ERFPSCMEMVQALRNIGVPSRVAPATMESVELPPLLAPPVSPGGVAPLAEQKTNALVPPPKPGLEPITSRRGALLVTPPTRLPETGRVGVPLTAPPEIKGAGVLYPALIIGLGQVGISVLMKLREALNDRFNTADATPNIRLLGVDLDP